MNNTINLEWKGDQLRIEICQGVVFVNREEAESLFVLIGHALQDDDIRKFDEAGDTGEQP